MTRYCIVGNSAGGIGAMEAIREVDRRGPITVISEEQYPTYSRPLIARYLSGETSLEEMAYRPEGFYRSLEARCLLGQSLQRLDLAAQTVELGNGQSVPWDRLLLAVGGTPIMPPTEGLAEHDVFTFTTLDDARRLSAYLPGRREAVVVGGGLIGLSVTEALVKRGLSVTIVELAPQILGRALDTHAAALARRALEGAGVRVLTGATLTRVVGRRADARAIQYVVSNDGTELPCDVLIVAIGVKPRTEVVADTDIAVGRGIIVDRHMATSHAGVYACGDVTEGFDFVLGTDRVTPIWPNAYLGGRIAGRNMAGSEAVYAGGTAMNSLHSFGLSIMSAGIVDPPADDPRYRVLRREGPSRAEYRKIVLLDDRVVGMIFAGGVSRPGIVFGLMKNSTPVTGFAERLLADDLSLLSLPAELRQQLIAAL